MRRRIPLTVGVLLAVCATVCATVGAEDWTGFRGPHGNGVSTDADIPVRWGPEKNILWKASLPGPGFGSPIVSNGRVFVTCDTDAGKSRTLLCFDRQDGHLVWKKSATYTKREPTFRGQPHSTTTPAADGKRVVVWHGSAGVFCYDFKGRQLWRRDLGRFQHAFGYGSSPVLYKGRVILWCGPGRRTFMVSLDLKDGRVIWKTEEPGGSDSAKTGLVGSWSTPMIVRVGGQEQIVCNLPTRVAGFNPDNGRILWWVDGLTGRNGKLVYTSSVFSGDVGVALGGYHGPALGFKVGGTGDVTKTNRLWRHYDRQPQRIGSGVAVGRFLYICNDRPGTVECLNLETGKPMWQSRLAGGGAWGSVVLADGRLYITVKNGTTHVFLPNPRKFQLVASNALGESSMATPAISDGNIFIRTSGHLFCIGRK